jgi:hypothetical protein
MSGRPLRTGFLWLLLALASAAGLRYVWRTFPQAFSLISLDLTMDRHAALARADSLAQSRGWGPTGEVRAAAAFDLDFDGQTFVELDGGGPDAFKQLLRDGRFQAYTWQVRRFAPGEVRETEVRFTPAGQPYGFRERIPEEEPGPALDQAAALQLAVEEAERWTGSLEPYVLVESGQEARVTGRVDHTFTWERTDTELGDGRVRLRVVIAGDRPVELRHYLQIPEAFTRRYARMRSANDAIASGALGAILLVYGLFGIGVGLFVMMRRRLVLWRPALIAGGVVAALQAAAMVNTLPLSWMEYDSAVPVRTFLAAQGGVLLLMTVLTVLQIALTAAAAEALTRAAFPRHPQFWRLWSRPAAGSRTVAGLTALGYLMIGLDLAWIVGFAKATSGWQGWWNPSDLLVQPNLLATWFPWLGPVALAFQAGFWEECLFRAVPLAGAALLGDRFGRRGLWLAGAMVLQALIFAAGHANYPAQPAYARVAELILPSLVFGAVYLRAGLLPAIIMHFGYDLALMALPVFVSEAPGIWGSRAMVLVAGLLPLGVVTWRGLQDRRWLPLPAQLRNGAWSPPEGLEEVLGARSEPPVPPAPPVGGRVAWWLGPVAIAGLAAWGVLGSWTAPSPRLETSRTQAVQIARDTLAARGTLFGDQWRTLASVHSGRDLQHSFVWRTAGDPVYSSLIGQYLSAPHWDVRFARFDGDITDRAEEWTVSIQGRGQVHRIAHDLPEARPGGSLSDSMARRLADSALSAIGLVPARLDLVALEPTRRAARTDWEVTYRDPAVQLPSGEARVAVNVAGDEVVDIATMVHVPEAWEREWTRVGAVRGLLPLASGLLYLLLLIGMMVVSVIRWTRQELDLRVVAITAFALLPVAMLEVANGWPALQAGFSTAEPWTLQATIAIAGSMVAAAIAVAVAALVIGTGLPPGPRTRATLLVGAALGGLLLGLETLAATFGGPAPVGAPFHLDAAAPAAAVMLAVPVGFIVRLALLSLVLFAGSRIARDPWRLVWYVMAGSLAAMGTTHADALALAGAWLAGSAALLATDLVRRSHGGSAVLAATATWAVLAAVQDTWRAGPAVMQLGVAAGAALVVALVLVLRPAAAEAP